MSERLNKELSRRGVCSRREADRLIESGQVLVNGQVAVMGQQVESTDPIEVRGRETIRPRSLKTLIWYKPRGTICTFSEKERPNINDRLKLAFGFKYAGRLDRDSEGLLVLSTDGDLIHRLTHPSFGHEKEYEVLVHRRVTLGEVERLERGLNLEDGLARALRAEQPEPGRLILVLQEGRNRQIRRMCKALGLKVERLIRTRFGGLNLDLQVGESRMLKPNEIRNLLGESDD